MSLCWWSRDEETSFYSFCANEAKEKCDSLVTGYLFIRKLRLIIEMFTYVSVSLEIWISVLIHTFY